MATKAWAHSGAIDLSNVSTEPKPALPAGQYRVRCTKAEPRETKAGEPQIQLDFEALQHVDGSECDPACSKGIRFQSISANSLFFLAQIVQATGVQAPASWGEQDLAAFCQQIVGVELNVSTKLDAYNGKQNAKITRYGDEPAGDGAVSAAGGERPRRGRKAA